MPFTSYHCEDWGNTSKIANIIKEFFRFDIMAESLVWARKLIGGTVCRKGIPTLTSTCTGKWNNECSRQVRWTAGYEEFTEAVLL